MQWFDFVCLWFAHIAVIAWVIWGLLHVIDYPVTKTLKWIQAYWLLVEYIFYRKKFHKWIAETKLKRIGTDGKWIEREV